MLLNRLTQIPDGLLHLQANELHECLGGPTLLSLPGSQQPPLFISVLMHGNETTGWDAVRQVLQEYQSSDGELHLTRSLHLFIANTLAAQAGLRHLPRQPDYNRVWPGSELPQSDEHLLMQQVVDVVAEDALFASVDFHNNTGLNPHYACVNRLDNEYLHLATLFGRTVVYFTKPAGVQSLAMSKLCPAVTLECGKVGNALGVAHSAEYIKACLHLHEHPCQPVAAHDIDLFHTTAIVKINQNINFGYPGSAADLELVTDLEHYNFRELPAGTTFARLTTELDKPLLVSNESGGEVAADYFEISNREVKTRLPVMPSMLTPDTTIIRQDCLCYLMERYPL